MPGFDEGVHAEHRRTNRVQYVITRCDGTRTLYDGGIITKAEVPRIGEGKWLDGVVCKIVREVYTPHLDFTWTVWCEERARPR